MFTKAPIEKKICKLIFFYFGLPTLSLELLVPQQWFTYQNLQDLARNAARIFSRYFFYKSCSDISKIKIGTVFNCKCLEKEKGNQVIRKETRQTGKHIMFVWPSHLWLFQMLSLFFFSRPTDSNFHR